jgi:hypothetical protein
MNAVSSPRYFAVPVGGNLNNPLPDQSPYLSPRAYQNTLKAYLSHPMLSGKVINPEGLPQETASLNGHQKNNFMRNLADFSTL